jgi:type VI secretion system secreted protein VgrG
LARVRMQEDEAAHKIARGTSACRAFTTGYKFDLEDHPLGAMNDCYVLTEIQHVASVAGSYSDRAGAAGDSYSNQFTCMPADVPFRPARTTPKPFVQGPQTAVVVGKSSDDDSADDKNAGGDGEEIWVDKWGRVLVLFPWDRKKATSCWMRVSQDWAGEGWGMINIPRVGQEVIVSFLEGDPDRPIITGRVYNDVQTVPYPLPDNGTRTTFRTSSSTGGGTAHYNELRFEDKSGKEQIFVRGEKDYDTRILNDSREWIGNDRSLVVTKDQMEKVSGDVHLQVEGKHSEKITGDMSSHISGNLNQKSDQTISIQAGMNLYEKSGQNFAHEAGMAIHLKAGMTLILEAGVQLSLKVGGNFIDIGPAGVSIQGTMVMINSGGAAGSGCGSSPADPTDPKKPDEADDGSKGTKM